MRAAAFALLHACGVLLYTVRLHRLVMWLNRRAPRVLLYHACADAEDDFIAGLGSNTTPSAFARHLAFLARHYRVITLAELESGRAPERAVLITFDDGYRSVYRNAFPQLRARGWPAVVYLIAGVMDGGALVWVNELNWLLRRGGAAARRDAARALGAPDDAPADALVTRARMTWDPQRVGALLADLRARIGAPDAGVPLYLSWDEAREMARAGIAFGNHTVTHPVLSRLSPERQRAEIADAHAAIAHELAPPTSLAYPFGDHDGGTAAIAAATGHRSVVEVGGGTAPLDLLGIGRVPVTATTDAGLFAELEVVAPVRALARRFAGG